jgi:hypothetical protein
VDSNGAKEKVGQRSTIADKVLSGEALGNF